MFDSSLKCEWFAIGAEKVQQKVVSLKIIKMADTQLHSNDRYCSHQTGRVDLGKGRVN